MKFSAIPGTMDPLQLNKMYRMKLKQSLCTYLKIIESTLHINLSNLRNKADQLNAEKRFSPLIFTIHALLRENIKIKSDMTKVFDCLHMFSKISDQDVYNVSYQLDSILTEQWETPFVEELRKENPTDDLGRPLKNKIIIRPIINTNLEPYKQIHNEALKIISAMDPAIYQEHQELATRLKLLHGQTIQGATSPRFFGAIFLRLPDPNDEAILYFVEHLVHEVSHLMLYTMMAQDPLITNKPEERYKSPIRIDERPMMGIYHATFVMARIVRIFKKMNTFDKKNALVLQRLKGFEQWFVDGLEVIRNHAKLTVYGEQVTESMQRCIEVH